MKYFKSVSKILVKQNSIGPCLGLSIAEILYSIVAQGAAKRQCLRSGKKTINVAKDTLSIGKRGQAAFF